MSIFIAYLNFVQLKQNAPFQKLKQNFWREICPRFYLQWEPGREHPHQSYGPRGLDILQQCTFLYNWNFRLNIRARTL